jgi:hypothetical protein
MDTAARPGAQPSNADGSLSRLLQTESLLAERLSAAEQEASRIRAAAREAATAADAGLAPDIEAATRALEREYAERRLTRLGQVEAEKARRVEALRAVPPGEVQRLAEDVIARVLADAAGAGP